MIRGTVALTVLGLDLVILTGKTAHAHMHIPKHHPLQTSFGESECVCVFCELFGFVNINTIYNQGFQFDETN